MAKLAAVSVANESFTHYRMNSLELKTVMCRTMVIQLTRKNAMIIYHTHAKHEPIQSDHHSVPQSNTLVQSKMAQQLCLIAKHRL